MGNRRSRMTIVEWRIAVIGAVIIEACRGPALLRPRLDPGLAVVFGVAAALDLCVHEPRVSAAFGAFPGVVLVDRLLPRRQIAVDHKEVIAGVPLGGIFPQLTLGDEWVRAVDDDQLLEHLWVIHCERPSDVGAPI